MNPGITEEVSKVAMTAVDALRTHPMTIALIVLNAVFLISVYLSVRESRATTVELTPALLNHAEVVMGCLPITNPKGASP